MLIPISLGAATDGSHIWTYVPCIVQYRMLYKAHRLLFTVICFVEYTHFSSDPSLFVNDIHFYLILLCASHTVSLDTTHITQKDKGETIHREDSRITR
jgi:hypothetical protein